MNTGITSEFVASLKAESDIYEKSIAEGKCASFDQYKYQTGYIQGLKKAEQLLHDTIEYMLKAQDLD